MEQLNSIIALGRKEVERLLTDDEVIQSQVACFRALSAHTTVLGERVLLPGAAGSVAFSYAARMSPHDPPVAKFGSVMPGNTLKGLPTVSSIVMALDPSTGMPLAVIDGDAITSRRTVAASVAVARTLGKPHPRVAVIGLGTQGELHAKASINQLGAGQLTIWDPRAGQTATIHGHLKRLSQRSEISVATSPRQAVANADVIFLCTSSFEPVLSAGWVQPGSLVISIGSFAPDRREVAREIMATSRLVVDHVATATNQCGQIVDALTAGVTRVSDLIEIGELLNGAASMSDKRTTIYSSVGVGVQDAAVVGELLRRAVTADVPRVRL